MESSFDNHRQGNIERQPSEQLAVLRAFNLPKVLSLLPATRFSLGQRLFLVATVALSLLLGGFYLVASQLYSLSLEALLEERLRVHTYSLLRDAENINGEIQLPKYLNDSRFNQTRGKLLAVVKDSHGHTQWQSQSALHSDFRLPEPEIGQWFFSRASNETGQGFFTLSYSTLWPDEFENLSQFTFTVLERSADVDHELKTGKQSIALALFVFAAALLGVQLIVLKLGLLPLAQLTRDIHKLNRGEEEKLPGDYSKELNPISQDINALIDNERRQRQRYQDRMADLSHSLKTPLSVLRAMDSDTQEDGSPLPLDTVLNSVRQQSERMNNIIQHQLQRAVTGHASASFVAIALQSAVNPILDALDKVYSGKNMEAHCDISEDIHIFADENDLLEILGNLLDNAYKYGSQTVHIAATIKPLEPGGFIQGNRNQGLLIEISDDGPGIAEEQVSEIIKRGVRLDSNLEGQGFGLAMVVEILDSYQAQIQITTSALGGAKISIHF